MENELTIDSNLETFDFYPGSIKNRKISEDSSHNGLLSLSNTTACSYQELPLDHSLEPPAPRNVNFIKSSPITISESKNSSSSKLNISKVSPLKNRTQYFQNAKLEKTQKEQIKYEKCSEESNTFVTSANSIQRLIENVVISKLPQLADPENLPNDITIKVSINDLHNTSSCTLLTDVESPKVNFSSLKFGSEKKKSPICFRHRIDHESLACIVIQRWYRSILYKKPQAPSTPNAKLHLSSQKSEKENQEPQIENGTDNKKKKERRPRNARQSTASKNPIRIDENSIMQSRKKSETAPFIDGFYRDSFHPSQYDNSRRAFEEDLDEYSEMQADHTMLSGNRSQGRIEEDVYETDNSYIQAEPKRSSIAAQDEDLKKKSLNLANEINTLIKKVKSSKIGQKQRRSRKDRVHISSHELRNAMHTLNSARGSKRFQINNMLQDYGSYIEEDSPRFCEEPKSDPTKDNVFKDTLLGTQESFDNRNFGNFDLFQDFRSFCLKAIQDPVFQQAMTINLFFMYCSERARQNMGGNNKF